MLARAGLRVALVQAQCDEWTGLLRSLR